MDANDFWKSQFKKNEKCAPRYLVETDASTPEETFMGAWVDKWHEHFGFFHNDGCGCCINVYLFDAPEDAVAEIPAELVVRYDEYEKQNAAPNNRRTQSQSSFREFIRSIKGS